MLKKDYEQIMKQIDCAIKMAWYNDISSDYSNGHLLKEDSLKNALYFHIRKRLDNLFQMLNIRMYTEYNEGYLKVNKMRADIAIVEIDKNSDKYYLGHRIENVLAIIELKYHASPEYMYTDVEKIKKYKEIKELENCQYYLGFLNENVYTQRQYWLDKRQTNNWARDCVTELDACRYDNYREGEIAFSIYSYNSYNLNLNTEKVEEMKYVQLI
ncbi:hypothetical protein [Clostridium butyricum]|uniref:hypothetical protein n=1 Tax=Clostridium butyricum TaxID=1492 RepID=UPI003566DEB4